MTTQSMDIPDTARRWCVYVDRGATKNLEIARKNGLWGVRHAKAIEGLREGDTVTFVQGIAPAHRPAPPGYPRLNATDFLESIGMAKVIIRTVITSDPFEDSTPVWTNDVYPFRFRFEELDSIEDVHLANMISLSEVEAIRLSLINGIPILAQPMPHLGTLYITADDDEDEELAFNTHDDLAEIEQSDIRYWVEKTLVAGRSDREHGPDALGKSLWSPQRGAQGRDVYRLMREVKPGDIIFHLVDNQRLAGVSIADSRVDEAFIGLTNTDWANRPAYRVQLRDYQWLNPAIERAEFLGEPQYKSFLLDLFKHHRGLFYDRSLKLHQGAYLTEAPEELVALLNHIYYEKTGAALPHLHRISMNAVEILSQYLELPELFRTEEIVPDPLPVFPINPEHSLQTCAHETGMPEDSVRRWVQALERKKQAIIFGPPGTGKTYLADHLARHILGGGDGFQDLVQFHPAYSYEDFIQGMRPKARDDGGLDYPLVPGRFLAFCEQAAERTGICVLIIDEINRANIARVFGELMYLLEYREKTIPLAGGGRFSIPGNVRIIGTMNTADRSIALVDHALRRRFAFLALIPDFNVLRRYHDREGTFNPASLITLLEQLNSAIGNPHYQLGISYFLHPDLETHLEEIWRLEIEPYLEEYFFDQPQRLALFRWDTIKGEVIR